ncbi:hypothetical protein [Paenibacillus swuensis]|uniref:hypothetical protein n=1 Tax=Paenibacillus swuensis TaxID=1178515 RepID=UPI000AFC9829|nr:hypothetical protein [Paenibacillus swuensis]
MHQSKKEQVMLSSTNRLLNNHLREAMKMAEGVQEYGFGQEAGLTGEQYPWVQPRKIRL